REVIQETHERGVAYTVIVPSSGETEGVRAWLAGRGNKTTGAIQVRDFPPDVFQSAAVTDYLFAGPPREPSEDTAAMQVFLKVPVEVRGNEPGYWIKAHDQAADSLFRRFRQMLRATVQPS